MEKESARRQAEEQREAALNEERDREWKAKKQRAIAFRKARSGSITGAGGEAAAAAAAAAAAPIAGSRGTSAKVAATSRETSLSGLSPKAAGSGAAAVALMNRSRSADDAVSVNADSASHAAASLLDVSLLSPPRPGTTQSFQLTLTLADLGG